MCVCVCVCVCVCACVCLGWSDLDFTANNVAAMKIESPEKVPVEIKEVNKPVHPDIKATNPPVLPSTGLYPFLHDKDLQGLYIVTLCTGYKHVPVAAKRSIGSSSFGVMRSAKCTTGVGGCRRAPAYSPDVCTHRYTRRFVHERVVV